MKALTLYRTLNPSRRKSRQHLTRTEVVVSTVNTGAEQPVNEPSVANRKALAADGAIRNWLDGTVAHPVSALTTVTPRNVVRNAVKQQEMQEAIQPIADHLRDIGAGHHSGWLIKITNTKELAAAARDIEQGGYYQEAAELYAIAAEFNPNPKQYET